MNHAFHAFTHYATRVTGKTYSAIVKPTMRRISEDPLHEAWQIDTTGSSFEGMKPSRYCAHVFMGSGFITNARQVCMISADTVARALYMSEAFAVLIVAEKQRQSRCVYLGEFMLPALAPTLHAQTFTILAR